jgi:C1A family cysteine protease
MYKFFNWKPDRPDFRDLKFSIAPNVTLPEKVDMRDKYDLIYDQGQLGSCTANATAMAYDYERIKQGLKPIAPSRLFIYYNERVLSNHVNLDSGAYLRDGIKALSKLGVCPEAMWPYDTSKFKRKPTKKCYDNALPNVIKTYLRIDNTVLTNIKTVLASGYGFVLGIAVYESFTSDDVKETGFVPMPSTSESLIGGHAVYCLGYDDSLKCLIIRNSWGPDWGDKGHFYLPYEYATNPSLATDYWAIEGV